MPEQSTGRLHQMREDAKNKFSFLTEPGFLDELKALFRTRSNPAGITKALLFILGAIATFVTMGGALLGYVRGYNRFMKPKEELPRLDKLPRIVLVSMALGSILIWVVLIVVFKLLTLLIGPELFRDQAFLYFLGINLLFSALSYVLFRRWRNGVHNLIFQSDKSGSARYAEYEDLSEFYHTSGLYIGGDMAVASKTHCLTVGGSRGGKGIGLIIPNVLRVKNYAGSMVLVDIKGEAAAVCARQLQAQGRNVVIINPWDLLSGFIGEKHAYNPLDVLSDKTSQHLVDDVSVMAELIVPIKTGDPNSFFVDSARNVVSALLLHLVTSGKVKHPTLTMLWEWCRLFGDQWDELLADMADSNDPVNGRAVRNAANEILKMSATAETFGSIMSNVLEATNFLKSGPMQDSLVSGFDPKILADGNTTVFVILPADKLATHGRYLRLVVITMLRAVVRKPNKRVTFIIDEAASIGYISEIPVALAAYAGFEITMWLIYQDLAQLQDTYGQRWESIIANSGIRHYFSIKDNTTAEYVSKAMGKKTRTVFDDDWLGMISNVETSERDLATPDEVVRMSKHHMIVFTGENPPARMPKLPYYHMSVLKDAQGNNLYDPNPYEKNSL